MRRAAGLAAPATCCCFVRGLVASHLLIAWYTQSGLGCFDLASVCSSSRAVLPASAGTLPPCAATALPSTCCSTPASSAACGGRSPACMATDGRRCMPRRSAGTLPLGTGCLLRRGQRCDGCADGSRPPAHSCRQGHTANRHRLLAAGRERRSGWLPARACPTYTRLSCFFAPWRSLLDSGAPSCPVYNDPTGRQGAGVLGEPLWPDSAPRGGTQGEEPGAAAGRPSLLYGKLSCR